jgi:LAO/AO transport system kinase
MHDLSKRVLEKEPRAAARALRLIDDRTPPFSDILKDLFPHTGKAYVVGVTGNPGAGKSTLVDRVIEVYRKQGKTVAVIAVDPTSPFSGGAILGDRIRMQRHAEDPGVFIRSVATRGHLGGLSRSARDMVRVLDAYGADVVLVETVGVGQDELEITRTAHTTLVVMAPGMGDEVQAIKAGILECADVFAVNKADREGVDSTVRDLELMIALGSEAMVAMGKRRAHAVHGSAAGLGDRAGGSGDGWTPPIVRCVSTRGEGVASLVEGLEGHKVWLEGSEAGRARRRARLAEEVRDGLREALVEAAVHTLGPRIEEAVRKVDAREVDPYTATEELVLAFREGQSAGIARR